MCVIVSVCVPSGEERRLASLCYIIHSIKYIQQQQVVGLYKQPTWLQYMASVSSGLGRLHADWTR